MIPALLSPYRTTVWHLPPDRGGDIAVLGAGNPASQPRSQTANRARDRRLRRLLGHARRAVGASPDDRWRELMWLMPYDRRTTLSLLRRFGQHAALTRVGGHWRLLWRNGICQPVRAPDVRRLVPCRRH